MVKSFLLFILLSSIAYTDIIDNNTSSPLEMKIKSFLTVKQFEKNKAYIDVIFSPKSKYTHDDHIDVVKVINTLKENGLLKLYFKKPKKLILNFKTSASPMFFVKLMGDTLRNIGYYRYVTLGSTLNSREFIWSVSLHSEYATDPVILQNELKKSGCKIADVVKNTLSNWTYTIDMRDAHLNVKHLTNGDKLVLKRSLYDYWLNIENIDKVLIISSRRNNWYPKISYYDSSLHLLKVTSKDRRIKRLTLNVPQDATYMKITDIYTLKNIRDSLTLIPQGFK